MPGTTAAPAARSSSPAIQLIAAAGAVAAAVGVWLVTRYGFGLRLLSPAFGPAQHPMAVSVVIVAVASAVAIAAGWAAALVIGRLAPNPRAAWAIVSLTVLALSLGAPLAGHGITLSQRAALACMHLAVGAVLIPAFARTLPGRRAAGDGPATAGRAVSTADHR